MKKILSLLMCIVMCISMFSATATEVFAVGNAEQIFSVIESNVKNGEVTYTIKFKSGITGFGGAILLVDYDESVLEPIAEECKPAYKSSGEQRLSGLYTNGIITEDGNAQYVIAYMNESPENFSSATDFFTMKFKVTDETRPVTFVRFYCKEYLSVEDEDNTIKVEDGPQLIKAYDKVVTLEAPVLKEAKLATGKIVVSWEETVGALSYTVLRQTADTTWEEIATVPAGKLEFEDVRVESGTTYYYSVQADNNTGTPSAYNTYGVTCMFVAKPEITLVENSVKGMEITWTKTAGADGYVLFRKSSADPEWKPIMERAFAYGEFYRDENVENGIVYEYDVCSKKGNFVSANNASGAGAVYLKTPDSLSALNKADGIELKWNENPKADYYVVYRKELGAGNQFTEYAYALENNFTDTNVTDGTMYYYSIQAVNDSSAGEVIKSAYSVTGLGIVRLPSTTVTNLEMKADGVQVSWEKSSTASSYVIYRSTDGVEWEFAGKADKSVLTYLDKTAPSGKTYYYSVVPCVGDSEGEKICSENSIYFIRTPGDIKTENVKKGIRVTWNVSAGSTQYWVYRKTLGQAGEGTLVATVPINAGCTYLDEGAVSGEVYSYMIKAISPKGNSLDGEYTEGTMRIPCVEGLKTEVLSASVALQWNAHGSADKYIVCRLENGEWKELAKVSATTYTDKTVVSGKEYAYGIKPVVGEYAGDVDEDTVKSFLYLAAPKNVKATNNTDNTTITWDAVDGAQYYVIYKSTYTSKGRPGEFKALKTIVASDRKYVDKSISAGTKYGYKVYAKSGDVLSVASKECVNVFLSTTKISKISNTYGGVKLSWSDKLGAQYYVIYCKEGDGDWKTLKTIKADNTSYVHTGAKNGVKTYYRVRAKNGDSLSSCTSKEFTHFASPVVTASNTKSTITLKWKSISGTKSYYVYRKGPGETSWKHVSTVTKNSYTDKNVKAGKTYTYTVKAYNGKIFSAYKTDGWKIRRLTPPVITSASNGVSAVTIKWKKVTGASGYTVYRRLNGETTWEKLGTTKELSYVDKTAASGKTYVYTVSAYYSSYSSVRNADGITIKRLVRPGLVSAKSSSKGITFKWKEVKGASGYYVYRKTGSGSYQKIATVKGGTALSYLDKSAKKGVTYTYTVKAYSGNSTSYYYKDGLKCKDKY